MPGKSTIAERSGVRAAMLSKGGQGERDENDGGPKHHGNILDRFRNSCEKVNGLQGAVFLAKTTLESINAPGPIPNPVFA